MRVEEVRVRNFRSLRAVDVELASQTVLLGPNNAGKSAFLLALHAAIGAGSRAMSADDIFVGADDGGPPKDRAAIVDVLVVPVEDGGERAEHFPEGSPWTELWGTSIQLDGDGSEFVAIRFQYGWNEVRGEHLATRHFLGSWPKDSSELEDAKTLSGQVRAQHIRPIALHYLGAARDIAADIGGRGSLWARLVAEPGLSEEDVAEVEAQLDQINEKILKGSDVLGHIQEHLKALASTVSCDADSVAITPLSRHLSDLRRGINVVLGAEGGPALSVERQGMGTRSLAAILLLKAYMTWRVKQEAGEALHPLVAVEEPETHLQPQAQRSLVAQMHGLPGQCVLTTHSPYVAAHTGVESFRHFSKQGSETVVTTFSTDGLTEEDLRKLDRQVLNTRGEILFARGVVFFEGETEEQAIPRFASEYWGVPPESTGLIFVGVGGHSAYLPFVRLAKSFGIPWWLFSDGEPNALEAVNKALEDADEPEVDLNPRVLALPSGQDFERYIAECGDDNLLVEMVVNALAQCAEHKAALEAEWREKENITDSLAEAMRRKKTMFGAMVGPALGRHPDASQRIPEKIRELFSRVAAALSITAASQDGEV